LFRLHAPFIASFLGRFGLAPQEIDDAVQEVFLLAHRLGGYQPGPAQPRTWLAALALRVGMKARHRASRSVVLPHDESRAAPASQNFFDVLAARQVLGMILDRMDPDRRAVFLLFEIEGETGESIAAALGIPIGTVYSRLHSARREFQAECA